MRRHCSQGLGAVHPCYVGLEEADRRFAEAVAKAGVRMGTDDGSDVEYWSAEEDMWTDGEAKCMCVDTEGYQGLLCVEVAKCEECES